MSLGTVLLYGLELYALAGLLTGLAFVTFGVTRVVPVTASIGARILIFPGAAAFWPYILLRWLANGRPR